MIIVLIQLKIVDDGLYSPYINALIHEKYSKIMIVIHFRIHYIAKPFIFSLLYCFEQRLAVEHTGYERYLKV